MATPEVGIQLNLKGYEGVMSDLERLESMLRGFSGARNRVVVEADLSKTKKEIVALEGELNKLKDVKLTLDEQGKSSEGLNNKIKETSMRLKDARQAAKEFSMSLREVKSFKQVFNDLSSKIAHVGSAMQSAGNALTRLTNPFRRLTSGAVMGAGYKMLNKFSEGLENGFNRYDTMKKYPKIMAAFGYSNEEAQKSIDALDKSVRGLPTGLDEMVDLAQRFTATTGDIDRGTKLAIATNRAFLASMSNDTQIYQGMMQLQDVLGGKDMNAKEWGALVSSMTPAIVKMGEAMKESGDWSGSIGEFIQYIRDGKMDNQKFIDQLIKIGDEGGILQQMADESKDTWQAFFANVGNAASRMTAGVIQSMDEVVKALGLKGQDGQAIESVNRLLADRVNPAIDNMTASLKEWINAHPEEIQEFFSSLASVNWRSILEGAGQGMLTIAQGIKAIADVFGGSNLSWLGKGMVYGNLLGNFLTITGGLLKGLRHPLAGAGTLAYKGIEGGDRKGGLFGSIASMFVGKNGEGVKGLETLAKSSSKLGKLSRFFVGWGEVATMIGGTALVAWGSMKLIKGTVKNFGEMVDLIKDIDWETGAKAIGGMTVFFGAVAGLSAVAGKNLGTSLDILFGEIVVGAFTTIATGFAALDMALIKSSFKSIRDATQYLNEAIENIDNIKSIDNVGSAKNKIHNAITAFNQIISMLQPDQMTKASDAQGNAGKKGLKSLSKDVSTSMKALADSLGYMKDAITTINELNKIKIKADKIPDITTKMTDALSALSDMLIEMPVAFRGTEAVDWSGSLNSTLGNLKTAFSTMLGKDGILTQMPKIVKKMVELTKDNTVVDLPAKMKVLGETLQKTYEALQGIGAGEYFASNIDYFRAGLKSLKFAILHLKEISGMEVGDGVVKKIQNIITDIQTAFDQGKIDELSTTINTFKTAISDALATFEEFNKDIEITPNVKLGSGFQKSVDTTAAKIRRANGEIRNAVDGIQTQYYKTVTVNVRTQVNKNRLGGGQYQMSPYFEYSARGGAISRHGVLYRSKGGSIFRPRGTDTIPAMLSEGEYVHNKKAVDLFGIDFMRKVNNLDVKGAMQSLLARGGNYTSNLSRQSIVNNTVNNNQRVTQNISTNNPNMAKLSLGRFAGAL